MGILDALASVITYPLLAAAWYLVVWLPMTILKYFSMALNLIGLKLAKFLIYKDGSEVNFSDLPKFFLMFTVIAVSFWAVILLLIWIRSAFISERNKIESLKTGFKYSFAAIGIIFLIPLAIGIFLLLIQLLINLVFGNQNGDVTGILMDSIKPNSINGAEWLKVRNEFKLVKFDTYFWMQSGDMAKFVMQALIIGIDVLVGYVFSFVTILQKSFDQLFLFIISPFVAQTMMIDGGKRMSSWKNQMISKSLVIAAILIGSVLFINAITLFVPNVQRFTNNDDVFLNFVVVAIVSIGGALSIAEFGNIVASFIGESFSIKESAAATRSLIKGATTMVSVGSAIAAGPGAMVAKAASLPGKVAERALFGKDNELMKLRGQLDSGQLNKSEYKQKRNDHIEKRRNDLQYANDSTGGYGIRKATLATRAFFDRVKNKGDSPQATNSSGAQPEQANTAQSQASTTVSSTSSSPNLTNNIMQGVNTTANVSSTASTIKNQTANANQAPKVVNVNTNTQAPKNSASSKISPSLTSETKTSATQKPVASESSKFQNKHTSIKPTSLKSPNLNKLKPSSKLDKNLGDKNNDNT